MPQAQKEYLIQEAKMQTQALQRLGVWRRIALSLTAIGILLAYTGFVFSVNILMGVSGSLIAVMAGGAAFLISVGRKNGKRNVENILKAAEG